MISKGEFSGTSVNKISATVILKHIRRVTAWNIQFLVVRQTLLVAYEKMTGELTTITLRQLVISTLLLVAFVESVKDNTTFFPRLPIVSVI